MKHKRKRPEVRPGNRGLGAPKGRAHGARPRTVYPKPRGASRRHAGIPCRVHTTMGEKTVGFIAEGPNGLEVVKRVRESKHLLRVADAWGVDLGLVERARAEGIGCIRLDETERGISYSTSPDYLLQHGFRKDFGHGMQVFLPRSLWSRSGAGQLELPMD